MIERLKPGGENSLAASLMRRGVIDWRFPNEYGFNERTLDCRQLSAMEVLRWKGVEPLLPIFMGEFDCSGSGLLLRRKEPELQMGWHLTKLPTVPMDHVLPLLRSALAEYGYALLYYRAFDMPFSAYYGVHDIVHWSLLIHIDERQVWLLDDAGGPAWFDGQIGAIPIERFAEAWSRSHSGGAAVITRDEETYVWEDVFGELARKSVYHMLELDELASLRRFIDAVEAEPPASLVPELARFEFDIHYFRRLRELWRLAVLNQAVPRDYLKPGWAEELFNISKRWSLVMGVLMKWKKQPDKDYQSRLVEHLRDAYRVESRFFTELGKVADKGGV